MNKSNSKKDLKPLNEVVSISTRFAKSTNVERDRDKTSVLNGYVPTSRTEAVLGSVLERAINGDAGGAWSITGPYGTGKSSLAIFLDALLGKDGPTRKKALDLLDKDFAHKVIEAHKRHNSIEEGFFLGIVTASKEPIGNTILVAIESAIHRRYGKIPSEKSLPGMDLFKATKKRLEDQKNDPTVKGPQTDDLVHIVKQLANKSPVLLLIDEFGKNLEAVTESDDADPYLLQQLAEAGSGSGQPIFLITLQHLSFEDYFAASAESIRKEWEKVQGRFDDISFIESSSETRKLLKTVFTYQDDDFLNSRSIWVKAQLENVQRCGLGEDIDVDLLEKCYPLDALSLAILPELCSRYGQNERTIFSFIKECVGAFLNESLWEATQELPHITLYDIFNYFVRDGVLSRGLSSSSNRWNEIALTLRDTRDLTKDQEVMAKSIAILNLVSTTGSLRASAQTLSLVNPETSKQTLDELTQIGMVTYRDHSEEFRIWAGSDIDLSLLLETAGDTLRRKPLYEILTEYKKLSPVVAARHSSEKGTLRIFEQQFLGSVFPDPPQADSVFDGLCLYALENPPAPAYEFYENTKPVVIAKPKDIKELDRISRLLAALHWCLDSELTQSDMVVRKELRERIAAIEAEFTQIFEKTFTPEKCTWLGYVNSTLTELNPGRGSSPLSEIADIAYTKTPLVKYSVINKHKLSTNGSRAQKQVIKGILTKPEEKNLGLIGNGAEVAAYKGFVEINKLHRAPRGKAEYSLYKPTGKGNSKAALEAWKMLDGCFKEAKNTRLPIDEIYRKLQSPPYGMKKGVIPIFLVIALQLNKDKIAIYENGTFQTIFNQASAELLIANPQTFSIKHFGNVKGGRKNLIDALQEKFKIATEDETRVSNVLSVLTYIITELQNLKPYTLRTKNLSHKTIKVRTALLQASEPDILLFEELPESLGISALGHDSDYEDLQIFVDELRQALNELGNCYENLLQKLRDIVVKAYGSGDSYNTIQAALSEISTEVARQEIRTIIGHFRQSNGDPDQSIEQIATVVVGKAIKDFNDDDINTFAEELEQIGPTLRRLNELQKMRNLAEGDSLIALSITLPDGNEGTIITDISKARSSDQALSNASDEDLAAELARRMSGNSLYDESFTPRVIDNVSNEEEIGETGSGT